MVFQTVPPLNYALALARLMFHHYILGTLLGLQLPIFIYCYFFEFIFSQIYLWNLVERPPHTTGFPEQEDHLNK